MERISPFFPPVKRCPPILFCLPMIGVMLFRSVMIQFWPLKLFRMISDMILLLMMLKWIYIDWFCSYSLTQFHSYEFIQSQTDVVDRLGNLPFQLLVLLPILILFMIIRLLGIFLMCLLAGSTLPARVGTSHLSAKVLSAQSIPNCPSGFASA